MVVNHMKSATEKSKGLFSASFFLFFFFSASDTISKESLKNYVSKSKLKIFQNMSFLIIYLLIIFVIQNTLHENQQDMWWR